MNSKKIKTIISFAAQERKRLFIIPKKTLQQWSW